MIAILKPSVVGSYEMDMEKFFRRIIILDCMLLVFFLVSGIFVPFEIDENAPIMPYEIVGLILLIVYFYNLYLLYNFKPLGRTIFIPLTCIGIGLVFAMPIEFTYHPNHFFYLAEVIGSMVSGAIITFIYFTDIKSKFEK